MEIYEWECGPPEGVVSVAHFGRLKVPSLKIRVWLPLNLYIGAQNLNEDKEAAILNELQCRSMDYLGLCDAVKLIYVAFVAPRRRTTYVENVLPLVRHRRSSIIMRPFLPKETKTLTCD